MGKGGIKIFDVLRYFLLLLLCLLAVDAFKLHIISGSLLLKVIGATLAKMRIFIVIIALLVGGYLIFTQKKNKKEKNSIKLSLIFDSKWFPIVMLCLILLLFVLIKLPFMGYDFSGEHRLKYNSYVEPAKYMIEKGNPFWYQQRYVADPINNPEGVYNSIKYLPIMEWGLAITYIMSPFESLRLNTRIFTTMLGIGLLILTYLYFRKISKGLALIVAFLLSINPIIHQVTFITVYDTVVILFMFGSLIVLDKYLKSKNLWHLFLAGLLFGLGNSVKYSLFLYTVPIALIIMLQNKNRKEFLHDFFIYMTLSILPVISFKTSLGITPTYPIIGMILFVVWIAVYMLIFKLIKKVNKKLLTVSSFIIKRKMLAATFLLVAFVLSIVFLMVTGLYVYISFFLTDLRLILNIPMYLHMANTFRMFMTTPIAILGLAGFVVAVSKSDTRRLAIALVVGSLVFWVIASKSMFFHSYYTIIIMVAFSYLAGVGIDSTMKLYKKRAFQIIILIAFILMVLPVSYFTAVNGYQTAKWDSDLKEVATFLEDNSEYSEFYIDEVGVLSLTIDTGRPRIGRETISFIESDLFKDSIRDVGFSATMFKYNIKYLITTLDSPRYDVYAALFSNESLQTSGAMRTEKILERVSGITFFSDADVRLRLIEEFNIKEKFILEKRIGKYKIYSFAG